jgi:hypothetical protein
VSEVFSPSTVTAQPHPIRLVNRDDLRRSRLTVFFRLLLFIPQAIWLTLWSLGVLFIAVAAWIIGIVAGRIPDSVHLLFAAYVRYYTHTSAYLWIAANPYPGFTGQEGTYPVDLEVDPPVEQSRLTILFRLILAIPVLFVTNILQNVGWLLAIVAWFIALFTGAIPKGLEDIFAYCLRFQAQTYGYVLFLTQRYPRFSDE